jgi:hypothetical protein
MIWGDNIKMDEIFVVLMELNIKILFLFCDSLPRTGV